MKRLAEQDVHQEVWDDLGCRHQGVWDDLDCRRQEYLMHAQAQSATRYLADSHDTIAFKQTYLEVLGDSLQVLARARAVQQLVRVRARARARARAQQEVLVRLAQELRALVVEHEQVQEEPAMRC
jgi:hypothetical protein